jgi:thiosulfate/3-mercaptopyruvate sulfurtransferase
MRLMYRTLIEPRALAAHLNDPAWAIVDCRFELAQPDWGERAYAAGHIPHARYAHLDRDLSGPRGPRQGRHPLPEAHTLAVTFGRLGIDGQVQVVAYDQGSGAFAARLWWLLRWLGHPAVAVLDGGFAAWQEAQLPVTTEHERHGARTFRPVPNPALLASQQELAAYLASGALRSGPALLVDARAADRFAGQNETLDPVAGHIPGARNHPYLANLAPSGRFRPAAELRRAWAATLRGRPAAQLVAMCGSGVTACHNLLALEVAELPGARLYAGSWSEWIRDPTHAVELGPEGAG